MIGPLSQRQPYTQDELAEYRSQEIARRSGQGWISIPGQADIEKDRPKKTRGIMRSQSPTQNLPLSVRSKAKRISARIAEAIESSRSILDLEDDWDEEGSPGYQESTWEQATQFIKNVSSSFRQHAGFWVDPPRILPGPKGSIDIHWKTSKRELLINISESGEEPAEYYGSGGASDIIKGKLDTTLQQNYWILEWLTR